MWQIKKAYCRIYQKAFFFAQCTPFFDWSEPYVLEGAGAIRKLPAFIKEKGLDNVLVVTDKGLMGIHLLDSLFEELEKVGVKYTVYKNIRFIIVIFLGKFNSFIDRNSRRNILQCNHLKS